MTVDIHANYDPADVWTDGQQTQKPRAREWGNEVDAAINALFSIGGGLFNGYLAPSVSSNVLTLALKTSAGNDPSAADPVYAVFRSATAANGDWTVLKITAALSVAVSAGATLGSVNAEPFSIWAVLFNDGGTPRLGVIRASALVGSPPVANFYPLASGMIVSATQMSGSATAAGVFYSQGAAVTAKPFIIMGRFEYGSGLATAGLYASAPTLSVPYFPGVKLPGDVVQVVRKRDGAVATGSTVLPHDDTIPQSGEGDQYLAQTIVPLAAANILEIGALLNVGCSATVAVTGALFQDAVANALTAGAVDIDTADDVAQIELKFAKVAVTAVSQEYKVRAGPQSAGTVTFNGVAGGRLYGGVNFSTFEIVERQG